MDEDLIEEIEHRIRELLSGRKDGYTTEELLVEVDCAEDKAQLTTVLNRLSNAGEIERTGRGMPWRLPGTTSGANESSGSRSQCGAAVKAFVLEARRIVTPAEVAEALAPEHTAANVAYHLNALAKRGEIAKPGKGQFAPPGTDKAKPPKKPVTKKRAVKPAPTPAAPDEPTQPAPPATGPDHAVTLTLNCPAGEVQISGTSALVFDLVSDLRTVAERAA